MAGITEAEASGGEETEQRSIATMTATLVTEIQHALEERLLPDLECLPSLRTGFAWPFLPKVSTSVLKSSSEMTRQDGTTFKRERSLRRKHYFLRTSSLDKIKQFPAYLCTKSSRVYPNALHFLEQLRAYVQTISRKIRSNYLIFAVYIGLILLTIETMGCCLALLLGNNPPGLIFLLIGLVIMGCIVLKTVTLKKTELKIRNKCD